MSLRPGFFPSALVALLLLALGVAGRSLDSPGLYYDEAIQARPAKEFATGLIHATPLPGSEGTWIAGRLFPVMTQPYMGALKSQALIPGLWIFGSEVVVLRAITLLWALLGVAVFALFCRRAYGDRTALFAAALLLSDPSFLLLARHDWGSFALSFLLRSVVLWCGWRWWETRRLIFLGAAAASLGLAFYNKVDVAIFALGAGVAVLAVGARPLYLAVRDAPRVLLAGAIGFTAGIAPMLPHLASVFAARGAFRETDELPQKLHTLVSMLDGSYFHELMVMGGLFDQMQEAEGVPFGPFGFVFVCAVGVTAALVSLGRSRLDASELRRALFALVASITAVLGLLALPGGVRIHHALNIHPFPHLLVAWLLGDLLHRGSAGRRTAQLAIIGIAAANLLVYERTRDFVTETGGRGRWSDSLHELAEELDADGPSTVVSLDWGFHESLGFLSETPLLIEAYPQIPAAVSSRGAWVVEGTPEHLYLLHPPVYDLFGYGPAFLRALERIDPALVTRRDHLDREGVPAFISIRIAAPHRTVFAPGGFRIQLDSR